MLFPAPALQFIVRVEWTQREWLCRYPLTNIRVVVAQSGVSVCWQWLPGRWWDLSTAQVELLDEEEAEQAKLSRHESFAAENACLQWLVEEICQISDPQRPTLSSARAREKRREKKSKAAQRTPRWTPSPQRHREVPGNSGILT